MLTLRGLRRSACTPTITRTRAPRAGTGGPLLFALRPEVFSSLLQRRRGRGEGWSRGQCRAHIHTPQKHSAQGSYEWGQHHKHTLRKSVPTWKGKIGRESVAQSKTHLCRGTAVAKTWSQVRLPEIRHSGTDGLLTPACCKLPQPGFHPEKTNSQTRE